MADNVSDGTCTHNSSEVSALQILFYPGGAAFKYLKQLLKGLGLTDLRTKHRLWFDAANKPSPLLPLLPATCLGWLFLNVASYLLIPKHADFSLPHPPLLVWKFLPNNSLNRLYKDIQTKKNLRCLLGVGRSVV